MDNLQLNWDSIAIDIDSFDSIFVWFGSFLPPQIMDLLEGFEETITSFLQNSGKRLLGSLLTATTTLTTTTGNFFINFIMAILASYFMISDYTRIMSAVKTFIGRRIGNYVTIVKSSALKALAGFVRSQLLLALFAFVCMFIALIAVRQPYALLIALFLAFVDLLPIVGTIAVLIPWGLFELAAGNINKAIYLLCVGVAFFLIRKVVEPKIVGSQTGLHPLAALLSTFIGLQFSGVWGAILGPVVLMMAISIYKTGIFDSTVSDVRSAVNNISSILKSK